MTTARTLFALLLLCSASGCAAAADREYVTHFAAHFNAEEKTALATLSLKNSAAVRELNFNFDPAIYTLVSADGEAVTEEGRLVWQPPADGGDLSYTVTFDEPRNRHKMTNKWVITKLDRLFPPARIKTRGSTANVVTVALTGPDDWSFESPFGKATNVVLDIPNTRTFTRPTGWIIGGDIGIRRTFIGPVETAIAAPKGLGFERMEVLTFLRWTMPELLKVMPNFPEHLLILGAPEEMWRGGLSGKNSLYLHSGRPLVSENSTSTLLHELLHVGGLHSAADEDDWIVEGLSEFYSIELLYRSGGISAERRQATMDWLNAWVERENGRLHDPSRGADTAAAVLLFADLAEELGKKNANIDEVTRALIQAAQPSRKVLIEAANKALGQPSRVLKHLQ